MGVHLPHFRQRNFKNISLIFKHNPYIFKISSEPLSKGKHSLSMRHNKSGALRYVFKNIFFRKRYFSAHYNLTHRYAKQNKTNEDRGSTIKKANPLEAKSSTIRNLISASLLRAVQYIKALVRAFWLFLYSYFLLKGVVCSFRSRWLNSHKRLLIEKRV